jgi:hypothetical protein
LAYIQQMRDKREHLLLGDSPMKLYKLGGSLLLFGFLLAKGIAQQPQQQPMDIWRAMQISLKGAKSITPKNGFVPDESTAAKIGQAAAIAQYGEKTISQEMPFRARLYGDTWLVIGTLHPEGADGGTAVIKISKSGGRILFMTHQQ